MRIRINKLCELCELCASLRETVLSFNKSSEFLESFFTQRRRVRREKHLN